MGTLVCTVELDKTTGNGIKVNIDNKDDGITQTIQMDGTSVTITVKKGGDTSTYTQTATDISIVCKTFEVTASETITMTSTKASTYESKSDAVTVQASKDLTLKSTTANLVVSATKDLTATGANIKATGTTEVTLAMGDNKLDLAAAGVTLSGAMVSVKASGVLTAEASGPATFKGAIANIQGNLVNLG